MPELPKRTWQRLLRFGEPWGLLAKANPTATLGSVCRHSIGWGLAGAVICGVLIYFDRLPRSMVIILIGVVLFAFVGGLCEWQIDNSDDDDHPR